MSLGMLVLMLVVALLVAATVALVVIVRRVWVRSGEVWPTGAVIGTGDKALRWALAQALWEIAPCQLDGREALRRTIAGSAFELVAWKEGTHGAVLDVWPASGPERDKWVLTAHVWRGAASAVKSIAVTTAEQLERELLSTAFVYTGGIHRVNAGFDAATATWEVTVVVSKDYDGLREALGRVLARVPQHSTLVLDLAENPLA